MADLKLDRFPVRVLSNGNIGVYNNSLGPNTNGQITSAPLVVDEVTLAAGQRVLVVGMTDNTANGIYSVTTVGTGSDGVWDRAIDFRYDGDTGLFTSVLVQQGTVHSNSVWMLESHQLKILGRSSGNPVIWRRWFGRGPIVADAVSSTFVTPSETLTSGSALSVNTVVTTDSLGKAVVADKSTSSQANRTKWLTTSSTSAADQTVNVLHIGQRTEASWTWIEGGQVYLGASGALTQTATTTVGEYLQQIAVARTATVIHVHPQASLTIA